MSQNFILNICLIGVGVVFLVINYRRNEKFNMYCAACGFTLIVLGFLELIGPMIIEQASRH
jgi:hypothetical protein